MKLQNKKLPLKKVTVLNFDEARRITGATGEAGCDITDVVHCPATGDFCATQVEVTCIAGCPQTNEAGCLSY